MRTAALVVRLQLKYFIELKKECPTLRDNLFTITSYRRGAFALVLTMRQGVHECSCDSDDLDEPSRNIVLDTIGSHDISSLRDLEVLYQINLICEALI